jgi:hypothetical protein
MEFLRKLQANETLRLWADMARNGVFPGAVAGSVVGLAPGILLILVLTGGAYYIKASEVLGFVVMSIAAGTVLGVCVGGVCAAISGSVLRRLRRY